MPTNTLSDSRCKAAKPADKDYKLFDGGGLFLFVSAKGAKTWRLSYRIDGKPKTKSFGPYPEVSLSEARQKRDETKKLLREGQDPMAGKKTRHNAITLAAASEEYWNGREDLSESYIGYAKRGIELHLCGALGSKPIGDITRDDLLTELNRMNAEGKFNYVRKVRMWVSQVFEWAIQHGKATINPAALIDPKKAFGRRKVVSFAALELRDMPTLMKRIGLQPELISVLACRMLALTWVRTSELRMMEWSEISGNEWIIPAGKMKRKKDLVIPLSSQAKAVLEKMKLRSRGSNYVFPSDRRIDRTISENTILYMIYDLGFKGKMTGHGFRSVASTWANSEGYTPDAIERQLAHVPENKVRSVYNRYAYIEERRVMLHKWADWLDECEN